MGCSMGATTSESLSCFTATLIGGIYASLGGITGGGGTGGISVGVLRKALLASTPASAPDLTNEAVVRSTVIGFTASGTK